MKLKPENLLVSNSKNATMVEADISAVWCNFNVHFGYNLPRIFPQILLTSVFIAMLARFWANCSAFVSVLQARVATPNTRGSKRTVSGTVSTRNMSVRSGLRTFFVPEPEHAICPTKSWCVAHAERWGVVRERVRTADERRSVPNT